MHCDQCRYALEGLPLDGKCPECGLAIAETIRRINERNRRRAQRSWVPVAVGAGIGTFFGVVVTLLALVGTDLFGGAGEFAALLFPVPFLVYLWTGSIVLGVAIALVQYPIYGAILGTCRWRSWHVPLIILLLPTFHLVAWAIARH